MLIFTFSDIKKFYAEKKKSIHAAVGLFALFLVLYLSAGFLLSRTEAFSVDDTLFQNDTDNVIKTIARPLFIYRPDMHPLYKLLICPIAGPLRWCIHSKISIALIVNSLFGALGVVLTYVFFRLFSKDRPGSFLLAIAFGLSMSQLFYGTVPGFPSLAVCSLAATYILFYVSLTKERLFFAAWVLAGAFTLGVAIVNIAQTLICFIVLAAFLSRKKLLKMPIPSAIMRFISFVLLLAVFLVFMQHVFLRPWHRSFFSGHNLLNNIRNFAGLSILSNPLPVIAALIKHFFVVNFIAPFPDVFRMPGEALSYLTFSTSWKYPVAGWAGLSLWIILLAGGIVKSFYPGQKTAPFYAGIVLCILANMALHGFYGTVEGVAARGGIEYFEYTGNFTFPVFLFLGHYALIQKPLARLSLLSLAALFGYNNLLVVKYILGLY